jgi:hypothetical protein
MFLQEQNEHAWPGSGFSEAQFRLHQIQWTANGKCSLVNFYSMHSLIHTNIADFLLKLIAPLTAKPNLT